MIVFERRIAQLFRAAVRRCIDGSPALIDKAPVLVRLGKNGVTMHLRHQDFAVIYSQTKPTGKAVLAFPLSALAQFEGKTADPVELVPYDHGKAKARWTEQGVEKDIELPTVEPEHAPIIPEMPDTFAPLPGHFLAAYHEACLTTAKSPTKYVVNRVLLKGKQGQIVGTDCSQLLVQGGFTLPFAEDLLLPRCGVFGLQPFRSAEEVQIGRTDLHVVFRLGAWSFAFTINTEGRFPDFNGIIPRPGTPVMSQLHLDEEDSRVMCIRLADLLRRRDATNPEPVVVTLDLHEPIRIRFRDGEMVREFPLSRSERIGKGTMLSLDLKWLLRVLHLGFRTFRIRDPEKPIVAEDGDRTFMVMPAPTHSVLKDPDASMPATRVERVVPSEPAVPVATALAPIARNGVPVPLAAIGSDDSIDLIAEAEGLRTTIMQAGVHAGKLIRFLRQVCRQPRVLQYLRQTLPALAASPPQEGHS